MWTFANFRTIASQRWPAATSASLIWLGFSLALVALIPACGGEIRLEPSVMEEGLEPSDAKESLETNIPAESRERSDEDSELGTLSQALTQTRFDANWTCPAGVTCEDTYDFTIPQGTRVQIAVSGLTGGSIPRMAALVAGSGNNLLTNDTRDWTCSDSNSVLFVAPTSGNYQLKIGRDGSSPGTTGQYTVIFEGNPSMTFLRVSGNDTTTAKQRTCGWETAISASYSCSAGAGCMNVYDFDVPVAGVASARVSGPANVSLSLSLWGPGRGPWKRSALQGQVGSGMALRRLRRAASHPGPTPPDRAVSFRRDLRSGRRRTIVWELRDGSASEPTGALPRPNRRQWTALERSKRLRLRGAHRRHLEL
jgi:hypothetical protein